MALKLGIQTYQILTNADEVCIPNLSSNLLAVHTSEIVSDFLPPNFLNTYSKYFDKEIKYNYSF
jgi:hypothetical protein